MSGRVAWLIVGAAIASFFGLLVSAIAYPDNFVIRDTASVAPWAAGIAAIVLATLTWFYVRATEDMARATEALAKETRVARELATQPMVVAEIEADQAHLFWLVVRNIGNAVAFELRFRSYPDMEMLRGRKINDLPLFNSGLASLGPGARIRTMLNFGGDLFKQTGPLIFTIRLSFKDADGTKHGPYEYPIDFEGYRGLILGEDPLTKELKSISDSLKSIGAVIRRP